MSKKKEYLSLEHEENLLRLKFGSRVRERSGEKYILAQVGPCEAVLVCLRDGNRYDDPVDLPRIHRGAGPWLMAQYVERPELTPAARKKMANAIAKVFSGDAAQFDLIEKALPW